LKNHKTKLSIEDISILAEDVDIEVKKDAGKDGKGSFPKSALESYSAMANTEGGRIFLGIEEKSRQFTLFGIKEIERVKKEIWDALNNRERISDNLLSENDITVFEVESCKIIEILVPRAGRKQRPVFVGKNPLSGTFRRQHEGDYKCSENVVKLMLAEQIEGTRDARVLTNFDIQDISPETLSIYRTALKNTKPSHPWNDEPDQNFLRMIGGWGQNRQTGEQALTIAGLLMFGKLRSILDEFPNYIVDYQERPEPKAELRWVDRITTDGSWSGNLYDFYRLAIRKLTSDLKVPFILEGDRRKDDTPVHESLREAL